MFLGFFGGKFNQMSLDADMKQLADYYARLHVGDRSYLLRESMNDLEASLDPEAFVRIHRSTIVNLDRVRELCTLAGSELVVVLADGTQLRMSHSRREDLESRGPVRVSEVESEQKEMLKIVRRLVDVGLKAKSK